MHSFIRRNASLLHAQPFIMSLSDFRDLGDGISLYEPLRNSQDQINNSNNIDSIPKDNSSRQDNQHKPTTNKVLSRPSDAPTLIIICTWLGGATNKRIQRYTQGYHNTWPSSSILLVRTDPTEYAFLTAKSLVRKLRPAQQAIRRIAFDSTPRPRRDGGTDGGILLHIFSNGGANIALQLLTSMNSILAMVGHDLPLPLRQIILDSCPGEFGIQKNYNAAAHSIPKSNPLRPLLCTVLYLVLTGIAGLETLGLRQHLAKTIRAQLNNPSVVSDEARRLYLASEGDTIVDARDVRSHQQEASSQGFAADLVLFSQAGHCSLVLENEDRYWGSIISCWNQSQRLGQSARCGSERIPRDQKEIPCEMRSRL